jgi:hypothetical protein
MKMGPGKSTYPLSANANVLSATFNFRFRFLPQCYINVPSAFSSNYDINILLSASIMTLKRGSYVSVLPAGGKGRKYIGISGKWVR